MSPPGIHIRTDTNDEELGTGFNNLNVEGP